MSWASAYMIGLATVIFILRIVDGQTTPAMTSAAWVVMVLGFALINIKREVQEKHDTLLAQLRQIQRELEKQRLTQHHNPPSEQPHTGETRIL